MKCDIAPETLISLLYDEMDLIDEKKIRQHMERCPSCQKAFQELQETTELLEKWEDETPALKTVFMQEPTTLWQSWKEKMSGFLGNRLAWSIPVFVGAVVILLFIFNFSANYENGNWQMTFGKIAPNEAQLDTKLESLFVEWQAQNTEQLMTLIQESEERQQKNFTLVLNEYAQQQELTRQQDLQLVGQGLEGLQRQTEGRYYQTSTLINDLIRMSNTQVPQP